ncbi:MULTISPECIES: dienelactone hydrolase [unclassified Pseudomonas]|uniref:alpha/beta hydrolase family protein n=1 Tax=unclassified Pseudomonas TaxID=196821 RepID=UPI00088FA48F|nr:MULTISPECIES: dienelactone hydrolase [unclassified Pseudomonas]QVM94133.1 dienelactone hydrolase [Pseudomonas sp. SORT22]UVL54008.1 dienelactone hydrolase [Pseudomonas sp. B21-035]SDQ67899.1 Predicted dienelactone hydrolase [Pseudomonas sp. UC 17F4]
MRRLGALLLLVLLGSPLMVQAEPAAHWSVGVHRLSFADPLDAQPVQALAFYPSSAVERSSRIDGYRVQAWEGAPMVIGRYPLLMLSHGNTGTPLALHDLATALARRGFIVVAVTHPGDNARDHSRLGTLSNLYGRPLQISAAITASLGDSFLAPYINGPQVGVIGYSAGGETALILSGAQPDLERLQRYCQERPLDADACKTKGVLIADRADLRAAPDPRVKALMLMAPLSLMFGRHALAEVKVPALIYSGDKDQLLAIDKNAQALARKLPVTPNYKLLAGAGHFVFMAPCDDEQRQKMAALCNDPDGVDREDIHLTLQAEAARFFNHTLADRHQAGLHMADQ